MLRKFPGEVMLLVVYVEGRTWRGCEKIKSLINQRFTRLLAVRTEPEPLGFIDFYSLSDWKYSTD
jgi:hypothetical protein